MLPQETREQEWAREIASFKSSICHFDMFLGFEGDIARNGATRSNQWFYESPRGRLLGRAKCTPRCIQKKADDSA